jgi:hypothetical protein
MMVVSLDFEDDWVPVSELEYKKIGTYFQGQHPGGFSCVCAGTRKNALEPFQSGFMDESFSIYGQIAGVYKNGVFYVKRREMEYLKEDGFDMAAQSVANWWE